jgi:glutamate dehydrogenase
LAASDIFVPCGGRPEAINMSNVEQVFREDKSCFWKVVVEGANLFFSQDARLYLEKKGIVVFKDASTNKG